MLGTSSIQGAVGYGIGFRHGFGLGIYSPLSIHISQ